MKFQFGNVVVVDEDLMGVIVKSRTNNTHDVYVRSYNGTKEYREVYIKNYIYRKELAEDEREFY